MDAYAVATIFDLPQEVGVNIAWSKLSQAAEQANLPMHAMLHCSWHVSISYSMPELSERLAEFARVHSAFDVHTVGLGVFTAEKPILYLPIVKTIDMAKIHKDLWNLLVPVSSSLVLYYSPNNWIPHITLCDDYRYIDQMCRFKQMLLFEPLSFRFRVDHLAVIFRNGNDEGVVQKFMLGGVL